MGSFVERRQKKETDKWLELRIELERSELDIGYKEYELSDEFEKELSEKLKFKP